MSHDIKGPLREHRRILLLGVAITVLALYMIPFDHLGVVFGKPDSSGKNNDGNGKNKEKNNNCENGLPPHKNGNSDNGNHYGCLKHL